MSKLQIRSYTELIRLPTFEERLEYLRLSGVTFKDTFGFDRYLNQKFYTSKTWKQLRSRIIVRDNGCDMATDQYDIFGKIIIHHMNPITKDDLLSEEDYLINPEYLICVSMDTHNIIHYGRNVQTQTLQERTPGDTTPWRR